MPYQQNTESFIYLPDATVIGDFIADGYESGFINTSAYSTISVNVKCSVAATLEIYSSIDINGSNPDLFFSKTLTINKSFISNILTCSINTRCYCACKICFKTR